MPPARSFPVAATEERAQFAVQRFLACVEGQLGCSDQRIDIFHTSISPATGVRRHRPLGVSTAAVLTLSELIGAWTQVPA